eukprot:1239856-Pyramimonas_sp.AAC.1
MQKGKFYIFYNSPTALLRFLRSDTAPVSPSSSASDSSDSGEPPIQLMASTPSTTTAAVLLNFACSNPKPKSHPRWRR